MLSPDPSRYDALCGPVNAFLPVRVCVRPRPETLRPPRIRPAPALWCCPALCLITKKISKPPALVLLCKPIFKALCPVFFRFPLRLYPHELPQLMQGFGGSVGVELPCPALYHLL